MSLRARLERLIYETRWTEEKQRQWLSKHGCDSWSEADDDLLLTAIDKLEFANGVIEPKDGRRKERGEIG